MEKMTVNEKKPSLLFSTRFFVAIVSFFGCAVIYSLRINLSLALVCMVNRTAVDLLSGNVTSKKVAECPKVEEATNKTSLEGEFVWSKASQGVLLGAFFWGYLFTQILGGLFAQKFGGTKVLTFNVLVSLIVTLLSPISARLHLYVLIFLRGLLGFAQGVTFPAFHTLWSIWAPPMERSILTSISYAGCQVGNLITLPLSSFLCRHGFAGGWPSVFYVLGIVAAVWLALWIFYVSDSPSKHKFISASERNYITSSLAHQMGTQATTQVKTPWGAIVKSMAVWAAISAHWAGDWAAYSMLTSLPTFLKDVLQMDIEKLGFLSAIPYIAYFLCINISGFLADCLRARNILSTTNTRKLMLSIALLSQAGFLLAAGYCTCGQEYLVIAFLTLGLGLSGFQYAGCLINYMDIAPRFAGTILGIGNTLSCISGILAPYAMGLLTPNGTRTEWLTLFWLTAGILIAGTLIFDIFAKGEVQPWAVVGDEKEPTLSEKLTSDMVLDSATSKSDKSSRFESNSQSRA